MKVQFLPFLFFFDSLSIKEDHPPIWIQEHKAFDYSASLLAGVPMIGRGLIIATEFIAFEKNKNLIRMTIDRY